VTDVDDGKVKRLVDATGATAVDPDTIYDQQADIFAPCALGAIVNDKTIPRFKFEIIAGGANNQLAEARHGKELESRSITYAPDYVINGGGLINVWGEINGWSSERSKKKAAEIYDAILKIFAIAEREGIPTNEAADRLAEERVLAVRAMSKMWLSRAER
jgi:leucine dehydrogenase